MRLLDRRTEKQKGQKNRRTEEQKDRRTEGQKNKRAQSPPSRQVIGNTVADCLPMWQHPLPLSMPSISRQHRCRASPHVATPVAAFNTVKYSATPLPSVSPCGNTRCRPHLLPPPQPLSANGYNVAF